MRQHVRARHDPHAGCVARKERALVVEVADVVRCVAGGGEGLESRRGVPDGLDVLLRHGQRLTVERFQLVAVEPSRGVDQARGIDDVRRADLGDVYADLRVLAHDVPDRAGVIEVDVREQHMSDLA